MGRHILFLSFILVSSCAELQGRRDLLAELDDEDESFYNPGEDFPVIGGDTGKRGHGVRHFENRAPASEEEYEKRNRRSTLKSELADLEDKQSEKGLALYEKHKHKLATTSEKIYYLRLPSSERKEYLQSRGFLSEERESYRGPAGLYGRNENSLNLGMTKNDVLGTWGKPARVEVAGNPSFENERWAYQMNGATKYIYFESGTVQGWE